MLTSRVAFCVPLAIVLLAPTVRGDILYRKVGGKIEGTVLEAESNLSTVTFQTKYGKLQIPRSEIDRIEVTDPEDSKTYKEIVSQYGDTAKEQFALAMWCLDHKYVDEYKRHLAEVIRLDPDHEEARRRLGYRRHDGAWMTFDEIRESQGYVKHRGRFILPQEKEQQQLSEVRQDIQRDFIRKIRLWRTWLRSGRRDKQEKAYAELHDLRDHDAVGPLMNLLGDEGSPAERYLLAEILEKIEGDASTAGLLRIAMEDDVKENRWRSIDGLAKRKSPQLVSAVTAKLGDNHNPTVRRAADLLGEIGDETVVPALADVLITEHRYVREITWEEHLARNSGSSIRLQGWTVRPDGVRVGPDVTAWNAAIAQNNAGGLSVGPQPTHVEKLEKHKNLEVLGALKAITGEDFGFDREAWLSWVRRNERIKAAKAAATTPSTTRATSPMPPGTESPPKPGDVAAEESMQKSKEAIPTAPREPGIATPPETGTGEVETENEVDAETDKTGVNIPPESRPND